MKTTFIHFSETSNTCPWKKCEKKAATKIKIIVIKKISNNSQKDENYEILHVPKKQNQYIQKYNIINKWL